MSFCPGSYSTGTNAFFHKQKKIGWLAPASAFASRFSKSKNLSKTVISKSRSKQSQNQDLKFITHHASVLHTTHNTQVICLSHTQENTRSKIIDSHHKDSQTKKINNRARGSSPSLPSPAHSGRSPRPPALGHALRRRLVRPQPAPVWAAAAAGLVVSWRPTAAGRSKAAAAGLDDCCWPAPVQGGAPAGLHRSAPSPSACSGGSSPCGGLRPRGGWPAPARVRAAARQALPAPGRGASKGESGRGESGREGKFTGRRCRGKKKEIRDGDRGAVKINKRMSIEVSP